MWDCTYQCSSDRLQLIDEETIWCRAILKPFQSNRLVSGHLSASFPLMATARPLNPPASESVPALPPDKAGIVAEQSLIALTAPANGEGSSAAFERASRLPVELDVGVPLRDFRVHNLLALKPGVVIASQWGHGEDVPLLAGDVQLAWSEFEMVDSQLAVRLTRLA